MYFCPQHWEDVSVWLFHRRVLGIHWIECWTDLRLCLDIREEKTEKKKSLAPAENKIILSLLTSYKS
jgi:hypothetical protein